MAFIANVYMQQPGGNAGCSPPHRWLRNLKVKIKSITESSPPHRWLRNQ
jgi:hypothetical protein